MTYKDAFDKLTEAYIKNQVNAYDPCGCFVGNLLDKNSAWNRAKPYLCLNFGGELRSVTAEEVEEGLRVIRDKSNGLYTFDFIIKLEKEFMKGMGQYGGHEEWQKPTPEMEDLLFRNFSRTIDLLKDHHIKSGEIIDDVPVFKKRELQKA